MRGTLQLVPAEEMQADNDSDTPPEAWAIALVIIGAFVMAALAL